MKIRIISFSLFLSFLFFFISCGSNEPVDSLNYWNSNTLTRNGLRGKVKTVKTDEVLSKVVEQYNQDGFVTQVFSSFTGDSLTLDAFTSITNYYYDVNGQLIKTDFNSSLGASYSETYEYKNTGKYVIQNPLLVVSYGLIPNLRAKISTGYKTDYIFRDNKLMLMETFGDIAENTTRNTEIKYNGNYPSSFTRENGTSVSMTFAGNGMFDTYSEESHDSNFTTQYKCYFKPDDKYLLIDSVVNISIADPNFIYGTSSRTIKKYTYDLNKNIISEEANGIVTVKYTYEYDLQKNWVSQTIIRKEIGSSNWLTPQTVARDITYWE